MEKYEFFVNSGHLVLFEEIDTYEKMFVDSKAVNEFNRLVKGKKLNLKDCENKMDKYIDINNVHIEFKDYLKIMNKLERMKKQDAIKKKRLFFGGGATIAASALMVTMLTAAGPKDVDIETLEATPIEHVIEEEKNVEESENILSQELSINTLSQEEVNNLTYTEPFETTYNTVDEENIVYVDAYSNYDEKLENNVNEYEEEVEKASEKWGVDKNLIKDIMKQESHGGTITNKMQIVFDAWKDQIIKVYSFNDKDYISIVLTDTPEKYPNVNQRISREELNNPYTNISVGTIMLAYTYKQCDNNLMQAIQAYNFGTGAVNQVLEAAALDQGISVEELRQDETNVSFMNYTDVKPANYGDHNYANKILAMSTNEFNLDEGKSYTMKYMDKEGNICTKTTTYKSAYNLNKNL